MHSLQTQDLKENTMAQARTLSAAEFEQLLAHIDTRKYAVRNRCMVLLTYWAGLRIGEVACLRWSDVINQDETVKDEIRLLPDMTKGRHARTVFVNIKLREELQSLTLCPLARSRTSIHSSVKGARAALSQGNLVKTKQTVALFLV